MVSAVIDGPKTTPSGVAPSSRATEARASATSASVRSAAWKAPPWLALWPERIQAAISSMASSTIWVPAAPSRRAQPSVRPGKRVRCMAADRLVACRRHATGRRRRDLAVLRAPRRRRAGAAHPGHERDAPGLGRRVPRRPGRRPRRRRLRPPRRRGLDAADRARSPSPQLADDAAGLLDALGWERAHVRRASRWAAWSPRSSRCAIPQRIRTLTLGCTYPGGAEAQLADPALIQELAGALLSGDRERALRAGFAANLSAAYVADEAHWEPFRGDGHGAAGRGAGDHAADAGGHGPRHERAPGRRSRRRRWSCTAPRTACCPVVNGELIARAIPDARLELLEGVGHMFWWEQPERSAALVRSHVLGG